MSPIDLSLLIPAYREARHLRYNLTYVCACLDELKIPFEVIVIDDGSDDGTFQEAIAASRQRSEIRVNSLVRNEGKGAALLAGIAVSRGSLIGFLDADLDLHPRLFGRLIGVLHESGGDAVIGSKWHPESRVDYPALRRLYSIAHYALVYALFGLPARDTQTGIKLFKRGALLDAAGRVSTSRFAFDLDLLVSLHRLGYRIVDAPITLEFHRAVGRIRVQDVARILIDTLRIYGRTAGRHVPRTARGSRLGEPTPPAWASDAAPETVGSVADAT